MDKQTHFLHYQKMSPEQKNHLADIVRLLRAQIKLIYDVVYRERKRNEISNIIDNFHYHII